MNPGLLLLAGAACLVAGGIAGLRYPRAWLGFVLGAAAFGVLAAVGVLAGGPDWEWRSVLTVGGEPLHLRLDGVSAVFLALLGIVGGAGAAYSLEYWPDARHPESARRGRVRWCGLLASMGGVLVASNGLLFLMAWELFTVGAFLLLALDRSRREARRAGWLYLAASHVGTVCLFAFFGLLAARTGSWDLGPMVDRAELKPLFWLALVGFGVKAGLFPFHVWLPSGHANAPSHVSAILSGVAIKMGVYGLVRFSGWLPLPGAAGWTLLSMGAASAVLGVAFALAQDDLKRLLAYCSVENVGIILAGLGAAVVAAGHGDAAWGRLALAGALLHVMNHGMFKALLFFGAGSVLHATGTREMSRLGGLWRVMPWTTALFGVGCLAVAGLPPLNGFVSEWLIYLGLFDLASRRDLPFGAAIPAILLLATAGAMALACFVKAAGIVFLGAPRTKAATRAHECGSWMRGAMLVLAAGCLLAGLVPGLLLPMLSRATGSWNPAWATWGEAAAPLGQLGSVQLMVAGLGAWGASELWRRANANGLRRGPTWDCGYSGPTPRMQYTSGSFAGIVSGWFRWILRPETVLRRPHGLLPGEAHGRERVPETVLEGVVRPAARWVMRVSTATRRLQHGRLSIYILYVVVGLVALGLLVVLGEHS